MNARRKGVTLIELVVGLAILAIVGSVAVAGNARIFVATVQDPTNVAIETAKREALRTGSPMLIELSLEGRARELLALPDGRIIGGEPFGYDFAGDRTADHETPPDSAGGSDT